MALQPVLGPSSCQDFFPSLSSVLLLQPLIPRFLRSSSTPSNHLRLGLPAQVPRVWAVDKIVFADVFVDLFVDTVTLEAPQKKMGLIDTKNNILNIKHSTCRLRINDFGHRCFACVYQIFGVFMQQLVTLCDRIQCYQLTN